MTVEIDQESLKVGIVAQGFDDSGQHTRLGPSVPSLVDGAVFAKPLGQVRPEGSGASDPKDSVQKSD